MKLVKGTMLTADQREQVRSAFQSAPDFLLAASQAEWINTHAFYIEDNGKLAEVPSHAEPAYYTEMWK